MTKCISQCVNTLQQRIIKQSKLYDTIYCDIIKNHTSNLKDRKCIPNQLSFIGEKTQYILNLFPTEVLDNYPNLLNPPSSSTSWYTLNCEKCILKQTYYLQRVVSLLESFDPFDTVMANHPFARLALSIRTHEPPTSDKTPLLNVFQAYTFDDMPKTTDNIPILQNRAIPKDGVGENAQRANRVFFSLWGAGAAGASSVSW